MRTTTKHRLTQLALVLLLQSWSFPAALAQNAAPGEGPSMITEWGEKVTPENAWREYPRPQMKRKDWTNLNGSWDYAITPMEQAEAPEKWVGEILVPFPLESRIGGVQRLLQPDEGLWYRRAFDLDALPDGRLLLHFEAVDYKTTVWVNGKEAGTNVGGSLPFSFDITDKVIAGRNEIRLKVTDRTDAEDSFQLVGKQRLRPGGITYTRVSGIWQTVWLEEVPETHIRSLKILGGMDGTIRIEPSITGEGSIRAEAWLDGAKVAEGGETLRVENPKLWSPDSPTLYDLKITLLGAKGEAVDAVESYTGLREVGKVKDADGNWRFTLNGEEIFHWGPLDQGWWPGGLLTPPSEEAMLFELDFLKKSGFNMIRKHIKVEPSRYYYHCDRMGFLVWQDQVSGGASPPWERLDPRRNVRKAPKPGDSLDAEWPDDEHAQWMAEHQQMIDHLYGHPSIVVWTPFNERWGQHRTMKVGEWVTKYDPSRLINIASGGNFFSVGDIADMHSYPHPTFPFHIGKYDDYIKVVGEFGGHGWKVEDHVWVEQDRYMVYGGMPKDVEEFKGRYAESIRLLAELKAQGVAGGVYTQTTDIEREINGLMTYDRKVIKIPAEDLEKISRSLFEPLPETATYLPVSSPHWKFTTKAPAKGWFRSGFDDSAWKTGIAGFGSKGTPGVTIQTDWTGREIWLRKSFGIGKLPEGGEFRLLLYHDEDVIVYLNGTEVVARKGYTTDYISVPLDAKARQLLKAGENVIAIHVRQTRGGQGIDAGLEWRETPSPQAAETAEPDLSLAGAAIQALVAKGDAEVLAMIKGSGGAMALTPEKARKFVRKALDQGLISKDDAGASTAGGKMPDFQQVGPALQALAQAGDKEAAKLLQSAMKTGMLPLTPESANALIERARAQGLLGGGENAKASPPDRPMLWKVTGKNLNAPSYLFGTIHTTTDRIRKFHPAAEQAFAEADVVVTEVPMSPEAQLGGQPLLMHGKSKLSERLDEETYGKLSDALKAINPELIPKPFEPLKTWAVAYQLIMLPEQIKGRQPLDQIIWNRAIDEGKSARGADTIENQYTAFDVLNEEEQITLLKGAIEQAGSGENMLREMVALYEKGDKEGIHTLMQDDRMLGMGETEEHRRIAEKLNAKLLGERDQRMTASIVAMLEAEPTRSHFFALGTAHFLGEKSIRAQLQEEGYTVVAVEQGAPKPTTSAAGNEKPDPYLQTVPGRWTKERINAWYAKQPWLVGCNYYPATAINQIEMWQESTWDPEQIDKELGWAADIGMNTLRVYLHDLVWADDEEGLYSRMDEFLNICRKHGIRPWFVFFDDCHFPNPTLGEQPLPVRAFHNSGWVNSPSRDLAIRYAEGKATEAEDARLKGYVQATMTRFRDDERVLMWELYNEPGRGAGLEGDMATTKARDSIGELSNRLVYDSWVWAREVNPTQPILSNSSGSVGRRNIRINRLNSDLHSIHSYGGGAPRLRKEILEYQKDGRPVMVTEWLARDKGSRVETCLPVMKELNAGAVNWGFVSGKSATIWNWESRRNAEGKKRSVKHEREAGNVVKPGEPFPEPDVWFHDLLRMDGTPYDAKEIETFKTLTSTGPVPVGARAADRPDIVVFLSDDHTWRDSSVYGSTEIETPHMARLAKAGMTFDRAFVASPSCAPSRAALLTGLYPANNGAEPNHSRPDADIRKLPAYLQELGYEVVSFGKVGHYAQTPEYGFDLARHFGYHEDIAIPKALEWLRERNSDQPLCLFVGSNWPHVPWPKKTEFDPAKLQVPPTHVDNPTTREWRAKYLAAVRKMDDELGQIYDLAREKLGEDTFFLHTSDHGAQWPFAKWNLYDDGIRTPLIVSWAGRIEAGKRTDAMVSWIDILPTLLEAAGGEAPEDIDGRSFLPVLEGTAESHRDVILTTHSGDGSNNVYPIRSALTADGWKYIRNLRPDLRFNSHATRNSGDGGYWDSWVESAVDSPGARNNVRRYQQRPAEELYRVTDDRWEMKNLIDDPSQAERVGELRKTVDAWMAETGDPQEIYGTPVKVAKADAPNIVTVFIDDMGWSDVSCFGGDVVKTENIDRLAAEGMKFTQFYVNSPICSPSRTALTTGQYPQRWRITSFLNNRKHNEARGMAPWLDPAAPVLARELRKNGYATGHFGKWHMGGQRDVANAPPISDYGFERSLTNFEGMGAKLLPLTLTPKSDQPGRIWEGAVKLGEPVTWMQRSEITAGFVDAALDFIDEAGAKGQPFFINVWPDDVHSPFFPPVDRWGDGGKRALYHAVLDTMDEQLGVLFDRIRNDEKLRDNTLVVFCSDNGHEPGAGTSDPLRGSKTWLYEGGIRSPLIVWGPGLLSEDAVGQTNDTAIFSAIDLNRSLYALTETPLPEGHELDGEDVLPAILGKAKEAREAPIFFRRPPDRPGNDKTWGMGDNPDLAVRDGKWKYLVNYDGNDPQLYDLNTDIAESKNLVTEKPKIAARLREAVFAWNATLPPDAGDPHYAEKTAAATGALPENQFVNPVAEGADPWVVRDPNADRYLWCFSEGNRAIAIHAGQRLTSLGEKHIVWTAPDVGLVSQQVWAPELHFLDGKWHIYFAASDGKNENHLAYALVSADADPLGEYTLHGPLETGDRPGEPVWAIDMTVLEHEGKRYALWSGWDEPGSDRQYLYAAAMKSPTEVVPPRVRICSNDDFPWEFTLNAGKGRGLNEAPQVIKTDHSTFVTYSCGASWKPTYKLGRLELTGRDPLDPLSWVKHKRPVFTSTDHTFGVGHSCFVQSPDGSQLWHVYHAKRDREDGWRRGIFVQPMDIGPKGFPRFFRPVAPGEALDRPAGEAPLPEIALPFESPLDANVASPWSLYGHHQRIAFKEDGLHLGQQPDDPVNDYRCGEKVMLDRAVPTDLRAEVVIDFRDGKKSRDAGIVFRVTGPAVGYDAQRGYFVGLIPGTNRLVIGRMDGKGWTELARAETAIDPTEPQRVAIEVKGNRLTAFHNGNEVVATEDDTYASGRIGLRVVNTHAVFQELTITPVAQ
ncbi:MAG: sulfatase-like hydrolase/transferase [Verrucomicrobiales bacterium]|nr:sulfatase-like hydrolase/transferase [Verrucomicrobiales bacterium]